MDAARIVLYYICSMTGFVMVAGGIWLIYKEKIYIDRESKTPVEIQSPLGSFKSNYPALALFVLGFFPLVYPIYKLGDLTDLVRVEQVRIKGMVQANAHPVLVYATRAEDSLTADGDFLVPVPFTGEGDDYKILLVVGKQVLAQARVQRKDEDQEIVVNFQPIIVEPPAYQGQLDPVPAMYQ
jgi:hypothetical protein